MFDLDKVSLSFVTALWNTNQQTNTFSFRVGPQYSCSQKGEQILPWIKTTKRIWVELKQDEIGHVTNASFEQWVGNLLMPKIDRADKNYLTPKIWEKTNLKKIFYGTLIFQQHLYWLPCPPTWRPKLLFAYILLSVWYLRSDVV